MKVAVVVLSILAFALGATSIHLFRQVAAERSRADLAVAEAGKLQTASRRMEGELKQLAAARAQTETHANTPPPSAGAVPSPARGENPAGGNAAAPASAPNAFRQAMEGMVRDPAMKKIMETAQRMMYRDLFSALNLSSDQTDQFMQILSDQQARALENMRTLRGNPSALAAANQQGKAATDAAMMNLLGTTKFTEYEKYQETLPERAQLTGLNQQLAAINAPLTEDQRKSLLSAMLQEKSAVPPPGAATEDPLGLRNPANAEWQADYDKRVRQRAERILTADQLKQYDQLQALQASVRSMMRKAAP